MTNKKPENPEPSIGNARAAASVGPILITLRDAIREVERCRIALKAMGFSQSHWQEIVNEVNPELRFVLRPQMLDTIIAYLKSVGKPVEKNRLARALYAQAVGPMQRIRQTITTNLRIGNLTLHSGNKVGLPAWREGRVRARRARINPVPRLRRSQFYATRYPRRCRGLSCRCASRRVQCSGRGDAARQ